MQSLAEESVCIYPDSGSNEWKCLWGEHGCVSEKASLLSAAMLCKHRQASPDALIFYMPPHIPSSSSPVHIFLLLSLPRSNCHNSFLSISRFYFNPLLSSSRPHCPSHALSFSTSLFPHSFTVFLHPFSLSSACPAPLFILPSPQLFLLKWSDKLPIL